MSKSYEEIKQYREGLQKQGKRYQCLKFASGVMYYYATGTSSSGSNSCVEFWNNSEGHHNMHAVAPSVAIWFNGDGGHAAFVEKVEGDRIYFSQANADDSSEIIENDDLDTYSFGKLFSNFKGYGTR